MNRNRAKIILFFGILCLSTSSIFVRFSHSPSAVLANMRMIFTLGILTPLILTKNRDELKNLKLADVLISMASGIFLSGNILLFYEAVKITTVAIAQVLFATNVIFTSIGFVIFMKGKIPRLGVVAIIIAMGGSIFIAVSSAGGQGGSLFGNILALLSAVSYSGYMLIGTRERRSISTNVYTWLAYIGSTLVFIGFNIANGDSLLGYGWQEWALAFAMSIVLSFCGHSILSWSYKYLTPDYVATLFLAQPVLAGLMAAALFGEIPTGASLFGGVIVLGAVMLFTWVDVRRTQKSSSPNAPMEPEENTPENSA